MSICCRYLSPVIVIHVCKDSDDIGCIFVLNSLVLMVGSVTTYLDRKFKRENPQANRNKLSNDRNTWYYTAITLGAVIQSEHEREQAEALKFGHGLDSQSRTENNPYVTVVKPEPARNTQRIRTDTYKKETVNDRSSSSHNKRQTSVQHNQQSQQQVTSRSAANSGYNRPNQRSSIQEEGYVSVSMERESSSTMPTSQHLNNTIYNDQYSKKE